MMSITRGHQTVQPTQALEEREGINKSEYDVMTADSSGG